MGLYNTIIETMSVQLHERPTRVEGVSESSTDGEVMLYSPGSEKAFLLNNTSAIIWQLCDGQASIKEIVEALEEAFPESKDQIHTDVVNAIESMASSGVLAMK